MSSSKNILKGLLPWLLILVGFFAMVEFLIPGGVLMILGLTILVDRVLSVSKGTN